MKSIIQEASTIAKAIEQGWIKAGKPKDFTVKIYEEPEKNFLGFTKKNAKVGIFFSERPHGRDGRDGRDGRRPQKHMPQRRRFRHRRDDDRRDGRGESREKWYKPQEERQDGQQQPRHDGQHHHDERRDERRYGQHDHQRPEGQRPEGQRQQQPPQQRPLHRDPHHPPFHTHDDDDNKDQS